LLTVRALYTEAALKCPVVGLFCVIITERGWTRQNGPAIVASDTETE
jgi:hypothetical protein